MRILLTGATGLIGHTVAQCLAVEHTVMTLSRRGGGGGGIRADLDNRISIEAATFPQIDALVHCAGVVDEDFRDAPERAFHKATLGADALVEKAVAAGAQRLSYVSSAHVYGPMVGRIDETAPANPLSNYAIAHFATEQVFRRHVGVGVSTLMLRPCAVFGDLMEPSSFRRWTLIPFSFPRDAVTQGEIVIRSTGNQRRNFVGTHDIATVIADWLARPAEGHRVVNPIGATSSSVHEFALRCARLAKDHLGHACAIRRIEPTGPTPGDDFDYRSVQGAGGEQSIDEFVVRLMRQIEGV